MFKKKHFLVIVSLILFQNNLFSENLKIITKVDNEIITNYDIIRETNYLEILNPNLKNLDKNKKFKIAKNSLINEIIKKKEIIKIINIEKDNRLLGKYLKSLYSTLNINNEDEFKKKLKDEEFYSLSEIKKKINIELYWNELIYLKYKNQVKIKKDDLILKVKNLNNEKRKEFLLSEIVFAKKKDKKLEDTYQEIILSINDIGFNNTANVYSISDSSKFGGKLGWIREESLSKTINEKLKLIEVGDYTDLMKLGNNYIILKIEDIKLVKFELNKEKEIEKLIEFETNRQLTKFSKIYFDKSKMNYSINEN